MCEWCPVVKGIKCSVCGAIYSEINRVIFIQATENRGIMIYPDGREEMVIADDSPGNLEISPCSARSSENEMCGGGSRVIRTKVSG